VETGSRRREGQGSRPARRLTVAEHSCWWQWWRRLQRFQSVVPPLFSYVYLRFFFFCFCSAAFLFLLLFLSMMVLLWLRTVVWRCGWQTAPVLLSTSSSFFASVFSLLFFWSFPAALFLCSLFPCIYRKKTGVRGLLPLPSYGARVGWSGQSLCNRPITAQGVRPLCFFTTW